MTVIALGTYCTAAAATAAAAELQVHKNIAVNMCRPLVHASQRTNKHIFTKLWKFEYENENENCI